MLDLRLTSRLSVDYNTPSTRVEDTLRTIVTSDHDYAQYIKVFGLSVSEHDTLDVYESYMFLSTILFLVLQRAKILESFRYPPHCFRSRLSANHLDRWVALKGLDDSVYHALHKIQGLQHLHVRLEPLAGIVEVKANPLTSSLHSPAGHPPPPLPTFLGSAKATQRQRAADMFASRRTFSGFKHLSSLALLDIDHIEFAGEIGQCLKGSSGTLKKLSLSFSKSLAMKARRPSAPHHGGDPEDDTETEPDEVDFDAAPTPPTTTGSAPVVSEADIRKERSAQETMLARIFTLEQPAAARKVDRVLEASAAATASVENPDRVFMKQLKNSMLKLQGVFKTTGGGSEGVMALKSIQKAAEKYLQNVEKSNKKPSKAPTKGPMNGVFPKKPKPIPPLTPAQAALSDLAKFGDSMPSSLVDPYWSSQLNQLSALSSMSGGLPASFAGKLPGGMYSFNPNYVVGEYNYVTGGPSQSSHKPPIYPHSHGSHSSSMHGSLGDFKKQKILNHSPGSLLQDLALPLDMEAHTKDFKKHDHFDDQKLEKAKFFLEHEAQMEQKKDQELAILMDEASTAEGEDWPKSSDDDQLETKMSVPAEPKADQQEDAMGVDIEHPDVIEGDSDDDQETVDEMEVATEGANGTLTPSMKQAKAEPNASRQKSILGTSVMTGSLQDALPAVDVDQTMMDDHVNDLEASKSTDQTMREYLHSTRGLPLEEFSLYLIPIKASVLVRAIDLTVLKRLTLLNVGSQPGFWNLMTRRQQIGPSIRLESIFTDNVTAAFLACLETFQGLTELFMLERGAKTDIESFAAKTNVGIEDIRKRALKRHIKTLKRLMIKNDEDDAWDADAQTVRLLTGKGAALEELAIGFSLNNYVS